MQSTVYEEKAHDWAEKKYNCKLRKKTWQIISKNNSDRRKIIPDFSSTDNSECVLGDAKAGKASDDATLHQAGYTILKMLVIEKEMRQQYKKFLVFENKEKGKKFIESVEGALVLFHLCKDSFEVWYYNGNSDEVRLYPLSS